MSTHISEELLALVEQLLRAQLNVIRQLRKATGAHEETKEREKSMSQMDAVYDILTTAQKPMHVDDIIAKAGQRFNLKFDKESVVSALTKRVRRQDRFIKTAPNTFDLISRSQEGGRQ
jgi:hypothetical protein